VGLLENPPPYSRPKLLSASSEQAVGNDPSATHGWAKRIREAFAGAHKVLLSIAIRSPDHALATLVINFCC
jgi:hypothetical protein